MAPIKRASGPDRGRGAPEKRRDRCACDLTAWRVQAVLLDLGATPGYPIDFHWLAIAARTHRGDHILTQLLG